MEFIEVGINEDVLDITKKLKHIFSDEITLRIPENAVLFENSLNLKLIRKEAGKSSKKVTFDTDDPVGRNLIESLDEVLVPKADAETGFVSHDRSSVVPAQAQTAAKPKRSFPRFPSFRIPSIKLRSPKFVILLLFLLLPLALGIYYMFWVYPKAEIKLVVSSQPLVKSVTVKLDTATSTVDAKARVLPGKISETTVSASKQMETTGEKTVGDKAYGKVTIFNKTNSDKKFKKGTTLTLITTKEALKFQLNEEVEVPKKTVITDEDPITEDVEEYGEKEVEIVAETFGSQYNLDDDKNFKIDDEDTDDFVASNDEKFKGGTTKTVKAVDEKDKTTLSSLAFESSKSSVTDQLKSSLPGNSKLLEPTVAYKKTGETFDKNTGDEADILTITQQVAGRGLTYAGDDLARLLEDLLEEFIPEGYELSEKDKSIEVGVLDDVLPESFVDSVDLQVKIRAYVHPIVKEDEIRSRLKGIKVEEGKEYLSSIKNIQSYEMDIWPKLTFFVGRFPLREERIEISIERQ